ncbi:uncharacterized protein YbjT (DUF2867 family) [Sphingomonas jejuensis]|uniref:Uncharacterized protein YbjT (DUF2867 family) n=1 Tax=Sphingomonas jejuensis TaxID=904715 RepID=A0ABX0XHR4_9SPHN|nr:NAD(P)H-binding protein [Sphingomonas jejuensis]NJC32883.1 uncharacterized protein YbjT (DUF2867 family) [Sphingomonas jejuensis]
MRVTVFGATGDQGCAQIDRLVASGHRPVAAVRDPSRLPDVDAVQADYRDHDSIRRAVAGSDRVFLTLPSTSFNDAGMVEAAANAVAEAARAEGTGMILFNTSMYLGDAPLGFAAQDARFRIRQNLFDSGVPTVSIQPVIYAGNLRFPWVVAGIRDEGVIRYPHDETLPVSWISQESTADLMIAAMDRPALAGQAFNVGGPDAICGPELARRLSPVVGRSLRFETLPVATFATRMAARFGAESLPTPTLIDALERIYHWYNHGAEQPFTVDMTPILTLLPAPPEPIERWAARQQWII